MRLIRKAVFVLPDGYAIRLARPDDLPHLADIERRAGARFAAYSFATQTTQVLTPPEALREGLDHRRLWLAVTAEDCPVGFALASVVEANAHLDELDVLPEHGQRGLGTALVDTVCAWGRENGFKVVTLSTFSHVPWNAPFYARRGFRILAPDELSEALQRILREEVARGLPAEQRVIMRREL
jgi:GNAT superfamily N-acetyltransferase